MLLLLPSGTQGPGASQCGLEILVLDHRPYRECFKKYRDYCIEIQPLDYLKNTYVRDTTRTAGPPCSNSQHKPRIDIILQYCSAILSPSGAKQQGF